MSRTSGGCAGRRGGVHLGYVDGTGQVGSHQLPPAQPTQPRTGDSHPHITAEGEGEEQRERRGQAVQV